jgi:hypothetical protein
MWVDTSGANSELKVLTAAGTWTGVNSLGGAPVGPMTVGTVQPVGAPVGALWLDTTGGTPTLKAQSALGTWTTMQALDATGKIDPAMLSLEPLAFLGSVDVTAPYVASATPPKVGDFEVVASAGVADATWGAVGVTGTQDAGDMLIWDGTRFRAVEHGIDIHPTVEVIPPTTGQTVFTMGRVPAHDLSVVVNGAMMVPGGDYGRVGDQVTFAEPLTLGDMVEFRYF